MGQTQVGHDTATIPIDRDILSYLKQQQSRGETWSQTLRRLLRLPGSSEDEMFLGAIRAAKRHTSRFLAALAFLYERDPARFAAAIQQVRGRRRLYFARTDEQIKGPTDQPRLIPGTPFWVLTNLNRERKKGILDRVLSHLGYSEPVRQARCAAVTYGTPYRPRRRRRRRAVP
jgi:negative modulator of initiation of replication